METVDGGVCSVHWTGLVALAWLDVDGMAAYGRSVALQDTRFALFLTMSLARELEYPLLSICMLLFSVAETHFFFHGHLSALSLLTF